MTAKNIGEYLANILPPDLLAENLKYTPMKEDGLRFGDDGAEASGVLVCWMATSEAIKYAIEKGCNVIVCHEDPYYQAFGAAPDLSVGWLANRERLRLLIDGGIALYRCHSPLDVLYNTDAALDALNLKVKSLYSEWIARVAHVESVTVGELLESAKKGFGVDQIRLVGDPYREISLVGISVGGMGLSFNGSFQEWLRRRGAEVIVTGEVDDYGAFWAEESGVSMIAVTHPACENPGLRRFYSQMRLDFPDIPVYFYESTAPYRSL